MSDDARLPETVQTVPGALAFWAERTPDAPALIAADRPAITYGALWRSVQGIADALHRSGIDGQDRVVLLLPEGPSLAIALLGAMSTALAVPLSVSQTPSQFAAALQWLKPAAVVVPPDVAPAITSCLSNHGVPALALHAGGAGPVQLEAAAIHSPRRCQPPRPEQIAFAVQTSGTTGKPKWVPTEHERVVRDGGTHRDRFGLHRRDRAIAVAPLTLSLGMTVLLHGIAAGAALIFPRAADVAGVWASIDADQPTWMFPAAGFLETLARYFRNKPHLRPPSSLRFVRVTAAPVSPAVCHELAKRLAAPILPGYSSSEAGLIATALPPPVQCKPGSCGTPIQEMRVVDELGIDVSPGVAGEIWVRGPKVFPGYLDAPETNASVFFPGGWFRTGDVGYLDEDGYLFLTGRLDEMINRGGAKIAPAEIDAVLQAHPAIESAAAFAVSDERLGEDVVVAVVVNAGAETTPRALRRWMLDRLEPSKVPRRVWFVAELPRTEAGKVRRGVLRGRYEGLGAHEHQSVAFVGDRVVAGLDSWREERKRQGPR